MVPMSRVLGITCAMVAATSCATGGDSPATDGGVAGDAVDDLLGDTVHGVGDAARDRVGDRTGDAVGSKDSGPDAPRTPKLDSTFPPYGLTWTPSGNLGRAGGLTWA